MTWAAPMLLQQQPPAPVGAAPGLLPAAHSCRQRPPLPLAADMLRQLFNSTMAAAFPDMAKEGEAAAGGHCSGVRELRGAGARFRRQSGCSMRCACMFQSLYCCPSCPGWCGRCC